MTDSHSSYFIKSRLFHLKSTNSCIPDPRFSQWEAVAPSQVCKPVCPWHLLPTFHQPTLHLSKPTPSPVSTTPPGPSSRLSPRGTSCSFQGPSWNPLLLQSDLVPLVLLQRHLPLLKSYQLHHPVCSEDTQPPPMGHRLCTVCPFKPILRLPAPLFLLRTPAQQSTYHSWFSHMSAVAPGSSLPPLPPLALAKADTFPGLACSAQHHSWLLVVLDKYW